MSQSTEDRNSERLDSIQAQIADINTSMAVMNVEQKHILTSNAETKATLTEISRKIDVLPIISRAEFEKEIAKASETYVKKEDIKGLLDFWGLATSTLGKFIASAIVLTVIYVTYQTVLSEPAVRALEAVTNKSKE